MVKNLFMTVDHNSQLVFMESFNTTILSNTTDMVNELKHTRNKKLTKSVEKAPTQ